MKRTFVSVSLAALMDLASAPALTAEYKGFYGKNGWFEDDF